MNPISDGYQKLLSSYKELEDINSKMVSFVQTEFPENSTLIAWGAVTYGSYVPGRSDFDFIIILQESLTIERIRELIEKSYDYCNLTADDLDILVIDLDSLQRADYQAISIGGLKRLDDMDLYIIEHFGKVLLGDSEILKVLPAKELSEFYPSSVRAFRRALQTKILNKFTEGDDIKKFIEANIVYFMLIFRILFTFIKGEVWGKIESINWVQTGISDEEGSALKRLGQIVKEVYLKNGDYKPQVTDFGMLLSQAVIEFMKLTAETEKKA